MRVPDFVLRLVVISLRNDASSDMAEEDGFCCASHVSSGSQVRGLKKFATGRLVMPSKILRRQITFHHAKCREMNSKQKWVLK